MKDCIYVHFIYATLYAQKVEIRRLHDYDLLSRATQVFVIHKIFFFF